MSNRMNLLMVQRYMTSYLVTLIISRHHIYKDN